MRTLLFFLEERSAEEFLCGLMPKIIPSDINIEYRVFNGKQDLNNSLLVQLKNWKRPNTKIVILQDQDSSCCVDLKQMLTDKCCKANREDALVRIACKELESWYLGDLVAVESALGLTGLRAHQNKKRFRNPDSVDQPAQALSKLTRCRYQKVAGSREIGKTMNPDNNKSRSFNTFISGVRLFVSMEH